MTIPYQKHSQTSREGYAKCDRITHKERITKYLISRQSLGDTGYNIARICGIEAGTSSARLRELEEEGIVIKTKMLKESVNGFNANIHVHHSYYVDNMGKAPSKLNFEELYRGLLGELGTLNLSADKAGLVTQLSMIKNRYKAIKCINKSLKLKIDK